MKNQCHPFTTPSLRKKVQHPAPHLKTAKITFPTISEPVQTQKPNELSHCNSSRDIEMQQQFSDVEETLLELMSPRHTSAFKIFQQSQRKQIGYLQKIHAKRRRQWQDKIALKLQEVHKLQTRLQRNTARTQRILAKLH